MNPRQISHNTYRIFANSSMRGCLGKQNPFGCANAKHKRCATWAPTPATLLAGLRITCEGIKDTTNYRRHIDPCKGIAGVSWLDQHQRPWLRSCWAPREGNLVHWHQSAPEAFNATVSIDDVQAAQERLWIASTYPGIDTEGWAGHRTPFQISSRSSTSTKAISAGYVVITIIATAAG